MCIYCTFGLKTMDDGSWVVLYCASDDSHVLVHDTKVLYDDKLNLEDEVNFDYPGSKKLLTGVIKGFSGFSNVTAVTKNKQPVPILYEAFNNLFEVDKKAMVKLMDKLNVSTKPKRERSFHADAPRKAAVKANESLLQKTKVVTQSTPTMLAKVLTESSDTDNDSSSESTISKSLSSETIKCTTGNPLVNSKDDVDDSHSETEDEMTEAEKALLAKLAAKKALSDKKRFKLLVENRASSTSSNASLPLVPEIYGGLDLKADVLALEPKLNTSQAESIEIVQPKNQTNSDATKEQADMKATSKTKAPVEPPPAVETSKTVEGNANANEKPVSPSAEQKRRASSSDDEQETKASKKSRRSKKKSKTDNVCKIPFHGEHYNHRATDPKVTKLMDDYEVYILEKDMRKIKTQGVFPTVTAMARFLTRSVYTEEARNICSVSGKPSLSKGKAKPEQRTMLDPKGVEAIIDFVTKRGERKNMKVPPPSSIKQSIGNMLCEERPRPESTE